MKATEARRIALGVVKETDVEAVYSVIRQTAFEGHFEVIYPMPVSDKIVDGLRANGYLVDSGHSQTQINWA